MWKAYMTYKVELKVLESRHKNRKKIENLNMEKSSSRSVGFEPTLPEGI